MKQPALVLLTATLGLAASAVTANFFVLGLERLEPDTQARQALVYVGLLMIAAELAAFGIASALPVVMRGLRARLFGIGVLLLVFEVLTIYVTQAALLQTHASAAAASVGRVADLRASIDSQRSAANGLRDAGALQAASANSWARHLGALDLRKAAEIEAGLVPLTQELARVEVTIQPVVVDVFGSTGTLAYTALRSMLMCSIGVVMLSTAGRLIRDARENGENSETQVREQPEQQPVSIEQSLEIEPRLSEERTEIEQVSVTTDHAELRYQRVMAGVAQGYIKPSILDVRAAEKIGAATAQAILKRMEVDGVTVRDGRVWRLS